MPAFGLPFILVQKQQETDHISSCMAFSILMLLHQLDIVGLIQNAP